MTQQEKNIITNEFPNDNGTNVTITQPVSVTYEKPCDIVLKFDRAAFAKLQELLTYTDPITDDNGETVQWSMDDLIQACGVICDIRDIIEEAYVDQQN